MLMPLLVRLTDSEIEAIDLVVSQGLYAIEDCGGAIEEVGSAGLAIHEELSFPDLHVEPVHRDAQLRGQFGSRQHARVMRPTGTLHRYWDPGGMSDSLDSDWEDLGLTIWGSMPLDGEGGGDLIVVHSGACESERLIAHLHSPRKFSNGIDPPPNL
jgi:hypothetical protein